MPPKWLVRGALFPRGLICLSVNVFPPLLYHSFHTSRHARNDLTPLRKQLKDAHKQDRTSTPSRHERKSQSDDRFRDWELTVGIEIHAQLNTIRKLFSPSRPEVEGLPNTSLAAFDIALPGSQPVLQLSTLIPALRAAIALNCQIEPVSRFDRKHYFYHDQPSGYQITQYYKPLARDGSIVLTAEDGLPVDDGDDLIVGIKQIQLEQDTAKTQESEDGTSSIDFTRSGQPLIEIISLPHLHSPEAAAAYLRKIQAILFSVDAVTTGMELGGLRADVNVSVRRINGPLGIHSYSGVTGLGQRTEIKNLSSFKAVEDAVKAERNRQINILEAGGRIEGETRGWSLSHPNETRRLRGKEGEVDYRYMPDPDLPPLYIGRDLVMYLRERSPPLPEQLVAMLVQRYGLTGIDARSLLALENGQRLIYFQDVVDSVAEQHFEDATKIGRTVGNWVLHELGALLSTSETVWTPSLVPSRSLARIIELQSMGKITGTSAKELLRKIFEGESATVDDIVTRDNLWFESMDESELRELATQLIDENPQVATSIRKGNHKKISFFVGQMMRSGDRNRIDVRKAEATLRSLLLS